MLKKALPFVWLFIALWGPGCHTARKIDATPTQVRLDERLEKIKMTDLKGRSFTLRDRAGKPVFLNFWATWCGPCVSEMQSIETLYQQFKNDVTFLFVSTETVDRIKTFREKHPFSFEFARLDIDYTDAYVVSLPTTLLVDRTGNLVSEEEGYRIWTEYNNLEKIKSLAASK